MLCARSVLFALPLAAHASLAFAATPPAPQPVLAPTPIASTPELRAAFSPQRAVPRTNHNDRGLPITFSFNFVNFTPPYDAAIPALQANLQAACNEWALVMQGSGNIVVDVIFSTTLPGSSRSVYSGFVIDHGTYSEWMQGWPHKQQTGDDGNGNGAEIEIVLDPHSITTELWFDPEPMLRRAPVPSEQTDAISMFLKMLGAAAYQNGWMDAATGVLPETYRSTYDRYVAYSPTNPVFTGPAAHTAYLNRDVPLTIGRIYGIGNPLPGNGAELDFELMWGPSIYRGVRYEITPLTVALATDANVLTRPVCATDINRDGSVSVQDIFDFLSLWFTSAPRADVNHDLFFTPQDIFDFLAAWFTGC